MTNAVQMIWDDTILPFQLDKADVRGRIARLDKTMAEALSQHDYPEQVSALLAEAATITALIGQTIKLRWKLSLQIRGDGPVRIIATDYYAPAKEGEPAQLRAYASVDYDRLQAQEDKPAFENIGKGMFAILIDQGDGNEPYNGITPLEGGSLAACVETYFAQSEQLPTRFSLTTALSTLPGEKPTWRTGGIMVQMLPQPGAMADLRDPAEDENWIRTNALLDTVEDLELVGPSVGSPDLVHRLFHEESPRIFDPQQIQFGCTCSEDKVRQSLSIYSAKDIATMTTEEGTVTADCQFCGAHYVLDPLTVGFEAKQGNV